jgi:protein O-mannosyl-transferase
MPLNSGKDQSVRRGGVLGLFALVLMLYWDVRTHEFVNYDDDQFVFRQETINKGLNVDGIIAILFDGFFLTDKQIGYWAPIANLSHMLDFQLYGSTPWGHHITNVLLHGVNSVVLCIVLSTLGLNFFVALSVAAIFAVHPINVEPVAWIVERKGLLSALFAFVSLGLFKRYLETQQKTFYWGSLLCFLFGLMSKATLIYLPLLLLIMNFLPQSRWVTVDKRKFLRCSLELVPFVLLSAIFLVQAVLYVSSGSPKKLGVELSFLASASNAFNSYIEYLGKILYPNNLSVIYPHPGEVYSWVKLLFYPAILILISYVVWRIRRTNPWILFGWILFFWGILPVSGIVQAGRQAMADRYLYIPMIGILIILVMLGSIVMSKMMNRQPRSRVKVAQFVAMFLVTGLLAVSSHAQIQKWKNSETLFSHAVKVTSSNYVALNNLGVELIRQHRYEEAQDYLLQSLKVKKTAHGRFNLARVRYHLGDHVQAEAMLLEGLKSSPEPGAYLYLSNIELERDKLDRAEVYLRELLRLTERIPEAHHNLGYIFYQRGRFSVAKTCFLKALQLNPEDPEAQYHLGLTNLQLGDWREALSNFNAALIIEPGHKAAGLELESLKEQLLKKGLLVEPTQGGSEKAIQP